MWETYGDDVQFYVVYIREAHAMDSLVPLAGSGNPLIEDPVAMDERLEVAQVCMTKLALEPIPALVDEMDDHVNDIYSAWPERLYLIGRDGKIAYRGKPGPGGFDPGGLEEAIQEELARDSR